MSIDFPGSHFRIATEVPDFNRRSSNPVHRAHALFLAAMLALAGPVAAQEGLPVDLTSLARGADRVVVATVTRVDPIFQSNGFGDQLIVSRTHLRVDTVLKNGRATDDQALVLELEGGTIGDLTLEVSDLPSLERGERAVLFLGRDTRGATVPHGRGQGILKLDSSDRVQGTQLTLSAVRQAVERAR
jgi:hypothetical protein